MKYLYFALIAIIMFPCLPAQAAEYQRGTIQRDGLEREYFIYDPRAEKSAEMRPLIIVLHGGGGQAAKFDVMTTAESSFDRLAEREDVLVVYPQGYKKNWNDGRGVEHVETMAKELDDVGFLSELIDRMIRDYSADPKRVYVTGPSNGGHMSGRMACDLAGKVAAVGIVIANMPVKYEDKCKPSAPVSVLIMNGTEDPLVPFNGGTIRLFKKGKSRGDDMSTAATFDFWLARAGNGKGGASVPVRKLPDTDPNDKTRVMLQDYKGKDAEVALYTVEGGGHTWPGGKQYLFEFLVGRVSHDINATQVIWDFFKRNPKP